jgi:hypothetical protein
VAIVRDTVGSDATSPNRDGRPVLVIDEDATIVIAHSEKQSAAATFKHTFGFHPGARVLR